MDIHLLPVYSQAGVTISFHARWGKNFPEFYRDDWQKVLDQKPQVLFFELATNDLDSRLPVATLVNEILEQSQKLVFYGVQLVIFGEVLARSPSTNFRPSTRNVSLTVFNQRVCDYNLLLKASLEDSAAPKNTEESTNTFGSGSMNTSENPECLTKLYKSIRGAIIQSIRHIKALSEGGK